MPLGAPPESDGSVKSRYSAQMLLRTLAERVPLTREPILLAWKRGWLRPPRGVAVAILADGRQLESDLEDRVQRRMYFDRFEPAETAFVRSILRPGDVVIDIGAHIGWFATIAARLVGDRGQVQAFEAYPPTFERLQGNICRNGFNNAAAHALALSDEPGEVEIGVQAGSDSGSVTALKRPREVTVRVPTARLDDVLSPIPDDVALLKIDVEGFEGRVLRGAPETLKHVRTVLIELNSGALKAAGSSSVELLQILAAAGLTEVADLKVRGVRRFKRSVYVRNVVVTRP